MPIETSVETLTKDQADRLHQWLLRPERKILEAVVGSKMRELLAESMNYQLAVMDGMENTDPAEKLAQGQAAAARRYESVLQILAEIDKQAQFTIIKFK